MVADTKEGAVVAPKDLRAAVQAITCVEVALEDGEEIWRNM